ncbi:tetratricopeptide repeat protein [Candidatus Poribacteria bacterium]|nr:tetratricopeptide repeat protein [Candidatus Poribacteria bacterium]
MRKLCLAGGVIVMTLVTACSSMKTLKPPRLSDIDVLGSSENRRVYQADYNTTFRAAVDSLRQIDSSSAKLVKHDSGIIVFKTGKGNGTVTANVKKIDEQTTRVELSAKTDRKYWFDNADAKTREKFFNEMDTLLKPAASVQPVETPVHDESSARPESQPVQETSAAPETALLAKVKQALGLGEHDKFLDGLANDDLALLDQRIQSLNASAAERNDFARKCANCYVDLARVYHDGGQYERAAEALKAAIATAPENAVAHCNLGEIYKHLRLFDDAIRELNEARRLNPDLPDIYINLGIIYDDYVVDDQKALEYYKKYLELGGPDKQVLDWVKTIEKGS